MKHRVIQVIAIFLTTIIFSSSVLLAQGISRSSGIGVRVGFWNITNHPTRVSLSGYGQDAVIDISGAGGWLYFFSRVYYNWFLEFSLGAVGAVHEEHSNYVVTDTEVFAIIPLLFGIRYDLLSTRFPSTLQPYLKLGGGPYWTTTTSITSNEQFTEGEQKINSDLKYGAYMGTGVNIVLTSWFALNFDLKYHLVNFQFERDYSGLEFGLGLSFMWGKRREIFEIKETKLIVRDIYPAYYQFYNTYPLALVSIKNIAGYPIEVNVRSYVRPYSERPKDSGYIRIERGETKDIPVTAIFGSRLQQVTERKPAVLDIEIEARAGRRLKKQISAQVMVHNRNAWNGEIDKLALFVTPDDEEILRLSRRIVGEINSANRYGTGNFMKARATFEELGRMGIQYHRDPNIPFYKDDRVQYALETIRLRSGDCDDLVVLYASLLESLGINTAFVEVQDPQKEIAHVYLIFDTALSPEQGTLISSNEKRFVIRENSSGKRTVWIPVETTLVEAGFSEAWKSGALQYLQEGILRDGIVEGWVKIIDVE